MAVNSDRQSITTDDLWRSLVFEYLDSAKRGKTNFYELLRTRYKCEKANTLKMYDIYELEYDKLNNIGIDEGIIEGVKDKVLNGIKTKNQRTLEKQKDIKLLRDSVESGLTDDYYIADGQYITYQRPLTMVEKATILKRASEIESEISKIEADYAPLKTANTDSEGKDTINPLTLLIQQGGSVTVNGSKK